MKEDDFDGDAEKLKCVFCNFEKIALDFKEKKKGKIRTSKFCSICRRYHKKKLRQIREYVFVIYNNTCVYCGEYANTIDHVIPTSKGGDTSYKNCVASCHKCNSLKSDNLT